MVDLKKINLNYLFLFSTIFLIIISLILIEPLSSGDTAHYQNQGNLIIQSGLISYLKNLFIEGGRPYYLYFFSILYTAFFKYIFLENWQSFFILSNLILSFIIFYNLLKATNNTLISKFFFFFLFILNIEQNQWNYYILGDVLLNFIFCLIFFIIIKVFSLDLPIKKNLIFLSILSFLAIFTKPTGALILGFLLLCWLFFFIKRIKSINFFVHILIKIILIFSVMALIFVITSELNLFKIKNYADIGNLIKSGIVIETGSQDRSVIINMGNKNFYDFLYLLIYKFIYFFKFWDFNFWSLKHNLINFIVFIPLYLSFFIACINFKNFSLKEQNIIIVSVVLIISIGIFHAITVIDFSFRFRLTAYCPLYYLLILNLNSLKKIFLNLDRLK